MRSKHKAILLQHQTQCLIESKLKCKCETSIFPDFTCEISEGPLFLFCRRVCLGALRVRVCVRVLRAPAPWVRSCTSICVCLFVCQVWNERRQVGDWRWGYINRLDSVSSSLSCILIAVHASFSLPTLVRRQFQNSSGLTEKKNIIIKVQKKIIAKRV